MARSAKPNVGVIGLGLIGSRVAANLRKAGYQVWVWSRSPRPEPNFLSSAAEVAESAKQIQIFVSDGAALLETVKAMAPALGPEHVVINHSTVSPAETVAASHVVQERHAKYLDAPFTGSRDAAAAGEIVFYIGGDAGALEKVRPQLEVNAKAILPVGEIGQAAALKIAMNVIIAVSTAAYSEALAIIDRSGIPLYKLGEAFQLHGANSPLGNMKLPGMIKGNFEPSFALKHMFKDVQIALNMASEYGIDLPASTAFAGAAMSGLQSGWAEEDFTVLARQYGFPNADHEIPEGTFPASGATSEPGSGTSASAAPAKKGLFPLFGPKS